VYGDLKGKVLADWETGSHSSFDKFAEDMGINTGKYKPIGIDVDFAESRPGELPSAYVSIITVDIDITGTTHEEMSECARREKGYLPVAIFNVKSDFNDILRRLKRFHIKIFHRGYDNFDDYNVIRNEDLR
jgi:hypothetical protein